MDGQAKDFFEYRVVEFKDETGETTRFLCQVKKNGENYGEHFEARDHEQVFAWLRLMMGSYPGTGFDDDNTNPGIAA